MTVAIAKWTLAEYHQLVATGILDDRRVELLRGELAEMSPEGEVHAYSSDEAGEYLARKLGDRARVRHAKPITLPNASEPEPDLAVVQRLGREYLTHHPYPENIYWVAEYSKTSLEKDLEVKTKIYAEAGIQEYWVINLKLMTLIVFREPEAGEYGSRQTLKAGSLFPLAFPELELDVSAILNP